MTGWDEPPPRPGWGPPAASGTWGTPPTKPKRRIWPWMLGGIGLFIVVVGALVAIGVAVWLNRMEPSISATNAIISDIKNDRYESAYARACRKNREQLTFDQFREFFETSKQQKGRILDYEVYRASVNDKRAHVSYWIEFARVHHQEFGATVVKEHGQWRPCLIE